MSIENPLDLDAVLANIEQTYSRSNEQFHERMAREAAESLMRDHCEELVEEVRQLRADLAEARRLMTVDFDRARAAEDARDALRSEVNRLQVMLGGHDPYAIAAQRDSARAAVARMTGVEAVEPVAIGIYLGDYPDGTWTEANGSSVTGAYRRRAAAAVRAVTALGEDS